MKCVTTYYLNPPNQEGYSITITKTYISFDKSKIDEIRKILEKTVGSWLVSETEDGEE